MPVRLPAAALRWGPLGAGRLPGPLSHLGVSTVALEVGRGPPCGLGPSRVDWGLSPAFGRAQRVGVGVCRGHEGAHPEGCPARPGKGQLQLQGLRALRPVSIRCGAPWSRPSSHVGVFGGRGREPSVSACSQWRLLLGCPTPGRPHRPACPAPPFPRCRPPASGLCSGPSHAPPPGLDSLSFFSCSFGLIASSSGKPSGVCLSPQPSRPFSLRVGIPVAPSAP